MIQMEAPVHFMCPPLHNCCYKRVMNKGNLLSEEIDLAPVHNPVLEGEHDVYKYADDEPWRQHLTDI